MNPWVAEWMDGLEVTLARAEFVAALWAGVVAHADGDTATATARRAEADAARVRGQAAVTARHANLHLPYRDQTIARIDNQTVYPYGYLFMTDTLCYWRRELAQLDNLLAGTDTIPPDCYF